MMPPYLKGFLWGALILPSATVNALSPDDFQLSGFGTIGMVLSDSDNYGYRSDISFNEAVFADDIDFLSTSNLGLQLDAFLSRRSQFTFQAILRDQSNTSFDRYISQAFYKHSFSPSFDVRLGRVPFDLFALTEYRNVNFAYPWAVTPNEVYGLFPHRHLDGIDLSYTFRPGTANLLTKFFVGESEGDINGFTTIEEVKLTDVVGASVTWSEINWSMKVNVSQAKFDGSTAGAQRLIDGMVELAAVSNTLVQLLPQPPFPAVLWEGAEQTAAELDMDGEKVSYMSLSGHYDWNAWRLMAEVSRIDSDTKVVGEVVGSYLSLSHSSGRSTVYGLIANTDPDEASFDDSQVSPLLSDPNSPLLNPAIVGALVAGAFNTIQPLYNEFLDGYGNAVTYFRSNQTSYAIGWRYDLKENIALNMQLNHTVIDDNGGTLWLADLDTDKGESVNTLFINVSFTF